MAIYIAIDGGGTKTEYLLLNDALEVMDRHVGSGSNHERLSDGYAGVKRTFYENLTLLLTRNGIKASEIQDVVAGLSGADNDTQTERLQEILRGFGFQYVMVCNDGYLPLKA